MDWGTVVLLTIWLGTLLLVRQRTEARRRRLVTLLLLMIGFLTWYWADYRGVGSAFWAAVIAALLLNFLFWLFVGRYNPVGSSDDIQVIGMDD